MEVQSKVDDKAEPVQPAIKRARTKADAQSSAMAKVKAAAKTRGRAAAKRRVQSDAHGSMNISEVMMKAAGAKKAKTGTGKQASK